MEYYWKERNKKKEEELIDLEKLVEINLRFEKKKRKIISNVKCRQTIFLKYIQFIGTHTFL